jgi:flagellar motor switch protein FliN
MKDSAAEDISGEVLEQGEAANAETADAVPDLKVVDSGSEAGASVQKARFAPLGGGSQSGSQNTMDLLFDVQLELSVELGRATVSVKDVLGLGPGSIMGLDKQGGEPVDILVNGRVIARGEVVVVDEKFGVRVTEIHSRSEG